MDQYLFLGITPQYRRNQNRISEKFSMESIAPDIRAFIEELTLGIEFEEQLESK